MGRVNRRAIDRRNSIIASLERKADGGITTYAAKLMADTLGGTETVCTVTQYCRTTVFEFPGCQVTGEDTIPCLAVCEDEALRAAVVSDLPAYFQNRCGLGFPHYAIDVSLRDGVDRLYQKESTKCDVARPPIFLVTEQLERIPSTRFENGECFIIDEWRDGGELIEGGREGERALLAFETINGAWPNFSRDQHAVNIVLAAVKVGQDVTHHIKELYSCSCFVSDDGRAVHTCHATTTMAYGAPRVLSSLDTTGLRARVAEIRFIHEGLRQTQPQCRRWRN